MFNSLEVISNTPGKGLLKSMDPKSPNKKKIYQLFLTAFENLHYYKQQATKQKQRKPSRMHRDHEPLNCTNKTNEHILSLAFLSKPLTPAYHVTYRSSCIFFLFFFSFFLGRGWFGRVTGKV